MSNNIAIEFNHVSKQYRLGLVSTRTLSHDIQRWWQTSILGHEDPYLKIGETNDRATKGNSEYVWALKDIDFKVEQGDVVGIIGKNGAGKSTLLKLLSRVTGPTTGTIRARGRIGSLLEVGTGFHQEMTGRENIFMNGAILGMTKAEIASKLDEIIDFSGCERYIDTPVKRYSSGMTVRLGFAVAAFLDPEILVVDEVLAVGDAEFQKKAIGKMKDISNGEGRTVLFVSHNMASIRALCTTGVLLDKGQIAYMGDINETVNRYLSGNANNVQGEKIIDSMNVLDHRLQLTDVTVNGNNSNVVELNWPNRTLEVTVKGRYDGHVPMDIEMILFSDTEIRVAKFTPSFTTGETTDVKGGEFEVTRTLRLPQGFTNGTYYLTVELTHPMIDYLAVGERIIRINVNGGFSPQGVEYDQRVFGFVYL